MPEYIDFEGKTTQEALDLAVEKTGLSPSNLKFEVVHTGGGGIFGISFKKAKIRVFLEKEEEERKEAKEPIKEKPRETETGKEWKPEIKEQVPEEKRTDPVEPPQEFIEKQPERELPVMVEKTKKPVQNDPPRSSWARPSKKAELPKKKIKKLTPEDLFKPAVPKDRIDVDLRDERDIRRAERLKRNHKKRESPRRISPPREEEKIRLKRDGEKADVKPPQDIDESQKDVAAEALRELLAFWMDEAEVESGWRDGKIYLNIIGDGSGLLIGRKGQTLDAIQFIVGKMVDKKAGRHLRLVVDTENYRERRVQSLERTAMQLAEKALSSNKGQTTGPMNPHDRRIIHLTLQEDGRFKTRSRGEGTYKRVLISVK